MSPAIAALHPTLSRLYGLWHAARTDGSALPAHDAIAPIQMMPLVPHLLWLKGAGEAVTITWTGTGVRDACGAPLSDARLAATPLAGLIAPHLGTGKDESFAGDLDSLTGRHWKAEGLVLPLAPAPEAPGEAIHLVGLIVRPAECANQP
ncbi:hypothetical protein [Radicibacter daui]|uniref:hypothetical protein n=1 Tax=Radicibacter daui TaxID=3064829 RepID=UPI004046D527